MERDHESYGGGGRQEPSEINLNITVRLGTKTLKAITDLITVLGSGGTADAARRVGAAADEVRAHKESLNKTLDKAPKT